MPERKVLKWTVSDCRIITTHIVAAATHKLSKNSELVRKAFLEYKISIQINSSQDHLIKIKDILNELINFTGWELQKNPIIKEEDFKEISIFSDSVEEFLQEKESLPRNNYKILLLKQLKELYRQRQLSTSNTKKVLTDRLKQEDQRLKKNYKNRSSRLPSSYINIYYTIFLILTS